MDAHRAILHSDCNTFYASVEQCEHPELRGKPIVVGGDEEARHGIVLTKSKEAKVYGIKTAETLWQARQKCPDLIVVPPDYRLYMKYSRMARQIYYQYTPQVEPFGLDECWLDVTGNLHAFCNDPMLIARELSERMKAELGITVSIGVSWNKIFAKFGSDYRKPDAITHITPFNYKDIVWPTPVRELLYVGAATERKLKALGIDTIGQLALADSKVLKRTFGKIGGMLKTFALGQDRTPVKEYDPFDNDVSRVVKSYGNGLTAPHDITSPDEAKALIMLLSESVAQRLREGRHRANCIGIGVRSSDLTGYVRQTTLKKPTCATKEVFQASWHLLRENEPLNPSRPLRALHVRASGLCPMEESQQLDLFGAEEQRTRTENLEHAVDQLRSRFGNTCIQRGAALLDSSYGDLDIKRDNVIHPVGLLGG